MYTYQKQDDTYFLFKDDEPLLTLMGNPVRTLYEPLAKRLLVDLDAFGEDPSDPISIVTFHYPMIDFYVSLPREELEYSIRMGLAKENDWTFNCPTANPHVMMRWLSIFGSHSSRAEEGEEWLATLTPMQLCAVCVIGRSLESVNVPFILGKVDLCEEYMEEFIKEIDTYYPYVGVDDLGVYFDNFLFYFHMGRNNPEV